MLSSGGWLVVGRNEKENLKIETLRQPGDWLLTPKDIPGPSAILRNSAGHEELATAASVIVRYAKKSALKSGSAVIMAKHEGAEYEIDARPPSETVMQKILQG